MPRVRIAHLALYASLCLGFALNEMLHAQTFTLLYSFPGGGPGALPNALTIDAQGNVFGTTLNGGKHNYGTMFELTPGGTETVLYRFTAASSAYPSGLTSDAAGNLYGVTSGTRKQNKWFGTVFKLSQKKNGGWKKQVLQQYTGSDTSQGESPAPGLLVDAQGNIDGAVTWGAAHNAGGIFQISPAGDYSLLYSFLDEADGSDPNGAPVEDSQGNLYGTTFEGGNTSACTVGCGTVFKLTPDGTKSVLYAFSGTGDGYWPRTGLVMDAQGNLYGATLGTVYQGNTGYGVVFKVAPDGTETVVHAFTAGTDGAFPNGNLLLDSQGNLYGTAGEGGGGDCNSGFGCGAVFKIAPDGTESILYRFSGQDGSYPNSLVFDSSENLYGTTAYGGQTGFCYQGCGVAYKLTLSH